MNKRNTVETSDDRGRRVKSSTAFRVLYVAGPGDAMQTFEFWRNGKSNPDITHVGYSHQCFDVCHELGFPLLAVTTHARAGSVHHGSLRVEQRPDPFRGKRGVQYHAAHLTFTAQIVRDVRRFGANVVILGGEPYAFMLEPLRWLGVRVVQALHCGLWPAYLPQKPVRRALNVLERRFYQNGFDAILSASEAINRQVRQVAHGSPPPLVDFLPLFHGDLFGDIPPPARDNRPFRVIFIARLETNKGIFDLIEVARQLRDAGRDDIVFDVCGDGGAREAAARQVATNGLQATVRLHGWCMAPRLRELLAESHVVIVPTTRDCIEGFNMVIVEALLAGRPVITSPVCPAVEYLNEGVIVVEPEDRVGYKRAILELADDRARFDTVQRGCRATAAKCLDPQFSYGSALRHVLTAFAEGRRPEPRPIPLERRRRCPDVDSQGILF